MSLLLLDICYKDLPVLPALQLLNKLYLLDEAPLSTERFDGANGESAQMSKDRSERHQRLVERAVCFMLLFRFKYTDLA